MSTASPWSVTNRTKSNAVPSRLGVSRRKKGVTVAAVPEDTALEYSMSTSWRPLTVLVRRMGLDTLYVSSGTFVNVTNSAGAKPDLRLNSSLSRQAASSGQSVPFMNWYGH